ncbi:MAG: low molecular weight phosphotyrosine protein phosphatase [Pseudomonadales bacterium]|jgi:protein-tyrosine phosphatase|nr:low molecular weight phosphotyrosine protein phosphatase [Pseudomonadales bacterium]
MTDTAKLKVLMVCLGNICRSPTAEATFQKQVRQAGLAEIIHVDSAGTSNWHVGEQPDARSMRHAALRDYDLSTQRARQVSDEDFARFDYIMAMDWQNLRDLQARCPPQHQHKLALFLGEGLRGYRSVPDPYEQGAEGFELVLDLCEEASAILLQDLIERLQAEHARD